MNADYLARVAAIDDPEVLRGHIVVLVDRLEGEVDQRRRDIDGIRAHVACWMATRAGLACPRCRRIFDPEKLDDAHPTQSQWDFAERVVSEALS